MKGKEFSIRYQMNLYKSLKKKRNGDIVTSPHSANLNSEELVCRFYFSAATLVQ